MKDYMTGHNHFPCLDIVAEITLVFKRVAHKNVLNSFRLKLIGVIRF